MPDQAVAVILALAVGYGAGRWLWWIESARRAEYAMVEAAGMARARRKQIQADIRARRFKA